jgi:hypothetical protein
MAPQKICFIGLHKLTKILVKSDIFWNVIPCSLLEMHPHL